MRGHRPGLAQPQHGTARADRGRAAGLLVRRRHGAAPDGGGGRMSELTATRSAEESEALRIFLRLIRPRPLADPYPLYARLRDLAPLLPVRFPGVPAGFLVSTFAGCSRL